MNLNDLADDIHYGENLKWWVDINTGKPIERNKFELIGLMHTELSEAFEAERKNLMDDKLPHRRGAEVELADCIIRILDYCAAFDYDIQGALEEKRAYNVSRLDHQKESRLGEHGKKI